LLDSVEAWVPGSSKTISLGNAGQMVRIVPTDTSIVDSFNAAGVKLSVNGWLVGQYPIANAGSLYQAGDGMDIPPDQIQLSGTLFANGGSHATFGVAAVGVGGGVTGLNFNDSGLYAAKLSNPVPTTTDSVAGSGLTLNMTWDYDVWSPNV
jgi:hypothetical protein